jgi:hypothetical protein
MEGTKLRALPAGQAALFGNGFDIEMLFQEIMVNRLLVLSFFIDKPNAIQPVFPAVITDPESPADILPPAFRR